MSINLIRLNWFIYESDIIALGGTVTYANTVIVKSKRSVVKEAIISLSDVSIHVHMECFRDGSSVLCSFLKDGKPAAKTPPDAETFLNYYKALRSNNDSFLEFIFIRTAKQVLLFLMQLIAIVALIHSVYNFLFSMGTWTYLVEGILAITIFTIGTRLYSHIRRIRFEEYMPLLNDVDDK